MNDPIDLEGEDHPFVERREVLRAEGHGAEGMLTVSGAQRACRVRDLTMVGLGLETRDPPLPGQRVWIELSGLTRTAAVVIWRDRGRCGLRFETRQVEHPDISGNGQRKRTSRGYRFLLRRPVAFESRKILARLGSIDISTDGMKLQGLSGLEVGSHGVLRLDGLSGGLPGQVCWRDKGRAGFRFDRPIARNEVIDLVNRYAAR